MTLAEQVRKIRENLLPSTIQYVLKESAFYKQTLKDYGEIRTVEDLAHLPILTKQTIVENIREILCNPQPDDILVFTSGTTSGKPFLTRRSRSEIAEIQKCRELLPKHNKENNHFIPLVLEITGNMHGTPAPSMSREVIQVPALSEGHVLTIHDLLASTFDFPGIESKISVLRIPYRPLQTLSLYFLQEGINCKDFGLKRISTTSFHISKRWRDFLTEQWQASLMDSYSLSEFPGNAAVQCEVCGYWHFVLPILIPEVVDPFTKQPIESGIGTLLLTGLYPFAQRQVLIRYWTGDLVERGPKCINDDFGFRMKGRLSQSILIHEKDQSKPLLLSFDLHDIIDVLPDINRSDLIKERSSLPNFSYLVKQELLRMMLPLPVRYTLENLPSGKYKIRLDIVLNYPPEFYPRRAQELAEYITTQLRSRNIILTEALDNHLCDIDVCFLSPHNSLRGILF